MLEHDKADRAQALSGKKTSVHIPDERLIHAGRGYVLFRLKACVRPLRFRLTGEAIQTIDLPWPAMVLLARNKEGQRSLRAFALASNQRPHAGTDLYHAPLLNIDSRGVVSVAAMDLPSGVKERHIDAWAEVLTQCIFTHNANPFALDLGRHPVATYTHIHALKKLSQRGLKQFPKSWLKPYGTPLGALHV